MINLLKVIGNVACWGTVVIVWIAGALYNAVRVPGTGRRRQRESATYIAAIVVCAIVAVLGQPLLNQYASVGSVWVEVLGLGLLVVSTGFTLWARFSLGTMWSVAPRIGGDGRLRTHGPYGVTRHPIYSGLLGMLLGTTLLGGMGRWLVLVAVGLILFEVKIRLEEQLLLATFPDEYPGYRQRVPQLVPSLHALRRRR